MFRQISASCCILSCLFDQALKRADRWDEPKPRSSARLHQALAEAAETWTKPSDIADWLNHCASLAMRRVNAIVERQHRGAYDRSAVLAAAVAEMRRAQGDVAGAERVFTDLLARHHRKPAFKKELNACRK